MSSLKKNAYRFFVALIILTLISSAPADLRASSVKEDIADVQQPSPETASEESEVFETETLKVVNHFDYYADSVSNLSDTPLTSQEIASSFGRFGSYIGNPGMPDSLYKEAMDQKWEDVTDRKNTYTPVDFNIEERYTYKSIVNIMRQLSRIDGVNMYKIGKTTLGQPMYAIEIDIPSKKEKDTVILTGTIHARETAGCTYIVKELVDLLNDSSKKAKAVLARTRFVAVPCVNPDGRDGVCFYPEKYTYKSKELLKATVNGTDINRNFPGLSWGQIAKGYEKSKYISDTPNKLYYPGPYAGSAPETRAMMKFLYHYIVLEKAAIHIDYHQQGRISYVSKPWVLAEQRERSEEAAKHFVSIFNEGQKKSSKNKYTTVKESEEYGLNGVGSTMTDYSCAIAYGAKYSRAYGFSVYCSSKREYPLIKIPRMDKNKITLLEAPNEAFITFTLEIGWGSGSLGYSAKARSAIASEYKTFHYDKFLYELSSYVYGLRG
ncbi:MAG: hypothetical protein K6F93_07085 [Lachnospiraceae bacterium]|nr:hypothetical protein [Lachnospiraceae bacterium]